MLRRTAIGKVGLFDQEDFPFHYEEADYGERLRRAGYKIVCDASAKLWHDSDLVQTTRLVQSSARAFHTARNRILFHRRYSAWWEFIPFILIFYPLVSMYYIGVIVLTSEGGLGLKAEKIWAYARGAFSGAVSAVGGA
jgi:GT2 family glycosyltransferase